jgi:hypothetical protein
VKKMFMAIVAFAVFCGNAAQAQVTNLSGVINRYSDVISITAGATQLTLGNASAFNAGDRFLIVQMKGASIDTTTSINFGDITGTGLAGNHEFATIQSIAGSIATLQNPLCKSYNTAEAVQIVSAPKYKSANITALVTADAWDGVKGGIVVIDVTDTLYFNDVIDVSGLGFMGGNYCTGGFLCGVTAKYFDTYTSLPLPACSGGTKGEGIALMPFGKTNTNLAKCANGGGASNQGNNGGAGGGNGGNGGRGGDEWSGCTSASTFWAPGGEATPLTNGRLFFGGGGGGGYEDNGATATAGGNAGGTVLIRAPYIQGNTLAILANGDDVLVEAVDEASGGGGAGGTVHLHTNNILSNLNVLA